MILSIDHVGIAVPDLDEAIAFYSRVIGLTCTHIEENPEQGVREAMLSAPEGGAMVQLLAPLRPDSPIGKFLGRSGPGIQQMAYRVDDVEATARAMLRPRRFTATARRWVPAPTRQRCRLELWNACHTL